jgi:hypothetical protein
VIYGKIGGHEGCEVEGGEVSGGVVGREMGEVKSKTKMAARLKVKPFTANRGDFAFSFDRLRRALITEFYEEHK